MMNAANSPLLQNSKMEETSTLKCSCCGKLESVVDLGNEESPGHLDFGFLGEDGRVEGGKKDLVATLLAQKCKACEKFACSACLGECGKCGLQTCKVCLDFFCEPSSKEQFYWCSNCQY